MCDMKQVADITFVVLILVLIVLCIMKPEALENWANYRQLPYGYVKTGSSPLSYYERPRYRKPYRYPFTFEKTYPVKHQSHLP